MAEAAERERGARELEDRIRGRIQRRQRRDRDGFRRFRPGPGGAMYSPWMSTSRPQETEGDLDHEIDAIGRALDEHGPVHRRELARLVGARYWGPGRFTAALREAVDEGRARRLSRATFAPPGDRPSGGEGASEEESAAAGHGVAGRTGGDR
jgi:hypothetical protein